MTLQTTLEPACPRSSSQATKTPWSYDEAFSRNRGLITPDDQDKLRTSRIAIAGLGGVGGVHLMTLARLGIGAFNIADPDSFEVANFNRQYGATCDTTGQAKAHVMAAQAAAVNPDLDVRVWTDAITEENVDTFLDGVDVLVDGIDFFSFDARRMLFREARRRGIWAVTAGPIGFSTAWLVFDPAGMSFDDYFDLRDGMEPVDQFAAFLVGLTPRGTHYGYIDLSEVDHDSGRGPSVGLACHLASGVVATQVVKILLGRGPLRPVPCHAQFDAYRCRLRRGTLTWGNRGPLQRLKRYVLRRRMNLIGYATGAS